MYGTTRSRAPRDQGPPRRNRRRRRIDPDAAGGQGRRPRARQQDSVPGLQHLKQAIADSHAKAGSIVVLDAKTGEILALMNWPTYNPNNRTRLIGAQLRNRAFTDTFEPGSTMKPFTAASRSSRGSYQFRHADPDRARKAQHRPRDDPRRPPARPPHAGAGDPEVLQRRHFEDRLVAADGGPLEDVRRPRLRHAAEARLPRRSRRPPAPGQELAADRAGDHVLRPRHFGDADPAGARLSGLRPRRRPDAAFARRVSTRRR